MPGLCLTRDTGILTFAGKVSLPSSLPAETQTTGRLLGQPKIIHSAVMTPWTVGRGKRVRADVTHSGDQIPGPLNNCKVHQPLGAFVSGPARGQKLPGKQAPD